MAAFSGAVKIGDLNDFIAPSQACVVALQQPAASAAPPTLTPPGEGLQLNVRSSKRQATAKQRPAVKLDGVDEGISISSAQQQQQQPVAPPPPTPAAGGFQQTVVTGDSQAIKVSLNDCLACSGCVTSAETVLLEAQSLKEFVGRCVDADTHVVVSISPQSRASLAVAHGISPEEVHARVAACLKHQLSVALVVDIALGQALALCESATEFIARYKQRAAAAAGGGSNSSGDDGSAAAGPLPMLASACPGWVCYAEKTHGSHVLPHIAAVRSPQGIMGALIKQRLAPALGWPPGSVYHVTVMPCYDKKLEAARDDFLVPGTSVAEVDCSLTTGELQELLQQYGSGDLSTAPAGRADNLLRLLLSPSQKQQQQQQPAAPLPEPLLHAQPGSSGGYADFIFAAAAQRLMGVDVAAALAAGAHGGANQRAGGQQALPFKVLRNADLQELQLQGPDGRPLLRFARAYGFRNIQTIMRTIKAGRCAYDYVEVMACPSGCLNGGGQLKPPADLSAAQLVDQLERAYVVQQLQLSGQQQLQQLPQQQPLYKVAPGVIQVLSDSVMQMQMQQQHDVGGGGVLDSLPLLPSCVQPRSLAAVYHQLGGGPGSPAAQALLHTQYHARPKTVVSALSDW